MFFQVTRSSWCKLEKKNTSQYNISDNNPKVKKKKKQNCARFWTLVQTDGHKHKYNEIFQEKIISWLFFWILCPSKHFENWLQQFSVMLKDYIWPLIKKLAWRRSTFVFTWDVVSRYNMTTKNTEWTGCVFDNGHRGTVVLPATVSMVPDRGVASHGKECQVGWGVHWSEFTAETLSLSLSLFLIDSAIKL